MPTTLDVFKQSHADSDGYFLATTLDPSNHSLFRPFVRAFTAHSIANEVRYATTYNSSLALSKAEATAWLDLYVALWKAGNAILAAEYAEDHGNNAEAGQWIKVYDAWKDVNNALILGYQKGGFAAWTQPALYVTSNWLRRFAIRADQQGKQTRENGSVDFSQGVSDDLVDDSAEHEKLEDAARQINRVFSLCISDRAPLEESRKWGLYYITNLLFKTYFKLNQVNLCKNPLRSIQATHTDMPPLSKFPKAHIITFKYYVGVISFLDENYENAEKEFHDALALLPRQESASSRKNHELILTYLIPTRLLTSHVLPTTRLLKPYPRLEALFAPLARCIKRGDLAGFDQALEAGSAEFVKRRIYLTLERGRDIATRNLFRNVFLAGGFDPPKAGEPPARRTRIPIQEFVAAVRLGLSSSSELESGGGGEPFAPEEVERNEVECMIANMISKGHIKGYISRSAEKAVLSKAGAFPGTHV